MSKIGEAPVEVVNERLRSVLEKHGLRLRGIRRYRRAVHNSLYRVETDKIPLILKCYRPISSYGSPRHRAMVESYVLGKATSVPKLVYLNLDPPWILRAYVKGIPYKRTFETAASQSEPLKRFGSWLSNFHDTFPTARPSNDTGESSRHAIVLSHLYSLPDRLITEKGRRQLATTLKVRPRAEIYARLVGDTDIANFVCLLPEGKIIGLDFEHSHYGDPAKDLALLAASSMVWADMEFNDRHIRAMETAYRGSGSLGAPVSTYFYLPYFVTWLSFLYPQRRRRCAHLLESMVP